MESSETLRFSPTQRRILKLLSDGEPHRREELLRCIDEETDPKKFTADGRNLQKHLCLIREKIRPRGHDIVCQLLHRAIHYRHIITLTIPVTERRLSSLYNL